MACICLHQHGNKLHDLNWGSKAVVTLSSVWIYTVLPAPCGGEHSSCPQPNMVTASVQRCGRPADCHIASSGTGREGGGVSSPERDGGSLGRSAARRHGDLCRQAPQQSFATIQRTNCPDGDCLIGVKTQEGRNRIGHFSRFCVTVGLWSERRSCSEWTGRRPVLLHGSKLLYFGLGLRLLMYFVVQHFGAFL